MSPGTNQVLGSRRNEMFITQDVYFLENLKFEEFARFFL